MKKLSFLILILSLSSCAIYRMPEDGEVSTIPTTNNPSVTMQSEEQWIPGVAY